MRVPRRSCCEIQIKINSQKKHFYSELWRESSENP
jgi:hypothetical protein